MLWELAFESSRPFSEPDDETKAAKWDKSEPIQKDAEEVLSNE